MAPIERDAEEHESAWELLPWYVNGSLSPDEAMPVKRHLANCPACRQEVVRCRNLSVGVKPTGSADRQDWAPSPGTFAQIMARVEAAGAVSSARRPGLARRLRSWLIGTPPPMRWAFALQVGLIVALSALLALAPSETRYETLSRATEPAAGERARLRVVFAADTTEKELRTLVNSIDARIVDGPTLQGVYTLQLSVAGPERARHISAVLGRHPKVHFAAVEGSGAAE